MIRDEGLWTYLVHRSGFLCGTNGVVTGPGKVWLQSLPLAHLAGALAAYLRSSSTSPTDRSVDTGASIAAAGIGLAASGLAGPSHASLLDRVSARADEGAHGGEDRAFLPNGGSDVPSAWSTPDVTAGADAPSIDFAQSASGALDSISSLGDQLPDVSVPDSDALGAATDAATSSAPDIAGSIFNVVGGLFNFGSSDS